MKEIKENLKMVFWSSLIAAALILMFSCDKQNVNFSNFDGSWKGENQYVCAGNKTLVIEFKKRKGTKGKNSNIYQVVGGNDMFNCFIQGGAKDLLLTNFELRSIDENDNGGIAKCVEDNRLLFMVSGDEMSISYTGVFFNNTIYKLRRVK